MEIMVAGQRVKVPEVRDAGVEPLSSGGAGPDGLPDFVIGDDGGHAALVGSATAPAPQFAPDVGTPVPGGPVPHPETFQAPSLPAEDYIDNGYLDYDPQQAQWTPGNPYRNVQAAAAEDQYAIRAAASRPSVSLDGDVARTGQPYFDIVGGMSGHYNPAHAWAQAQQQNAPDLSGNEIPGLYSDNDRRAPYSLQGSLARTGGLRDNCHTWRNPVNGTEGLGIIKRIPNRPLEGSTWRRGAPTRQAITQQQRRPRKTYPRIPGRAHDGVPLDSWRVIFWRYAEPATAGSPVPGLVFRGRFAVDAAKVGIGNLGPIGAAGWNIVSHFPPGEQRKAAQAIKALRGSANDVLRDRYAFKRGRQMVPGNRRPVVLALTSRSLRAQYANARAAWDQGWWVRPNADTGDFYAALRAPRVGWLARGGRTLHAALVAQPQGPSVSRGTPPPAGGTRPPAVTPDRSYLRQQAAAQQSTASPSGLRLMGLGAAPSTPGLRISNPSSPLFVGFLKAVQKAYGLPESGVATPQTIRVVRAAIASGSREGRALAKIFYIPRPGTRRMTMLSALNLYDSRLNTRVQPIREGGGDVLGVQVAGAATRADGDAVALQEAVAAATLHRLGLSKNYAARMSPPVPGAAENALVRERDGLRRSARTGGRVVPRMTPPGRVTVRPRVLAPAAAHRRVTVRTLNNLAAKVRRDESAARAASLKPGLPARVQRVLQNIAARSARLATDLDTRVSQVETGQTSVDSQTDAAEVIEETTIQVAEVYEDNARVADDPVYTAYEQSSGGVYEEGYELPGGLESTFGGVDPRIQAAIDAANAGEEAVDAVMVEGGLPPEWADDLQVVEGEDAVAPKAGGLKKLALAAGAGFIAWKAGLFG